MTARAGGTDVATPELMAGESDLAAPQGAVSDSMSVAVWTIISRFTGVLRGVTVAAVLGATYFANTYQFTNSLPNLVFYGPRTAHGSSLSPGVHAALFARDGKLPQALEALRLTARIDLDDISESTAGGVHIAAMASLWQAVVMGFGGVRPSGEELLLDPHLPGSWEVLEFPVTFKGAMLTITITSGETRVRSDRPTRVNFAGRGTTETGPGETVFATTEVQR